MKTKTVDVGRITGFSSYELAVKNGSFTGTEQDYVNKEMNVYNDMKTYADDSITTMNQLVADITNSIVSGSTTIDLSEVVASRGTFNSLPDRLLDNDNSITTILARLQAITNGGSGTAGGDLIEDAYIDNNGYLVVKVKDSADNSIYGNIEMRNTGSQIQWRSVGFVEWQPLVRLQDLMPKFTNVIVNAIDSTDTPSGSITNIGNMHELVLNIPKGEDGVNGGQILDAEVNTDGELILTVSNSDYAIVSGGTTSPLPMLSIGTVTTVGPDVDASASITGTPTNPILNLEIPRGKTTRLTKAYVGTDGLLVFNYEEV